jgi:deoxyribonuclease-4
MRIGAHVPTRGRFAWAIEAAKQCGAQAIQVFVSNPRAWAPPRLAVSDAREFAERRLTARVAPVYGHSTYLVNIASPDPEFWRRSVELAREEMEAVALLGADGLVVHAGAGGPGERPAAVERAARAVHAITGELEGPELVLEMTAGGAGTVASTIPQAAELLETIGPNPRVSLCVDTCHLFAAGYALDSPRGVKEAFSELRDHRLIGRLRLVHANDAKFPRGSHLDRHEHVGHGFIGDRGFRAILAEPAVRGCAVLVETPGKLEDHKRNVARLRQLAGLGWEEP